MADRLNILRNVSIDLPFRRIKDYPNPFGVDRVQTCIHGRVTELEAIQRMTYGLPIPPTDTIGEAIREGKKRCARCQQFKGDKEFSRWLKKETGVIYVKRYCNHCRVDMEKTKRFGIVV